MLHVDPARGAGAARGGRRFVLYVEGPRDRGILSAWAQRLLAAQSRPLFRASVILGGRRPDRAEAHFRELGGAAAGVRALCVLDRDGGSDALLSGSGEPGLELFTWSRRHIESYLLVPGAIRRAMRLAEDDRRIERVLRSHLPSLAEEEALRDVDAKRLVGTNGVLSRALGRPLPLGRVARAMREPEIHADVHRLFDTLRGRLGLTEPERVLR